MQAQSAEIRASEKSDYSRLVFDFENATSYTLNKTDGDVVTLILKTDEVISKQEDVSSLSRLSGFTSKKSDNEIIANFQVDGSAELRHFSTGSRIIIDVSGNVAPTYIETLPEEPVQEEVVEIEPPVETEEVTVTEETPVEDIVQTVEEEPVEEVVEIIEDEPKLEIAASSLTSLEKPHVITVSSTNAVGLSVFKDWQRLWIVIDQPDFAFTPALAGEQVSAFPDFQRVDFADGSAFYLDLPDLINNIGFRAEGGGLNWKIILSPDATRKNMSDFVLQNNGQGVNLKWMTASPTKSLAFVDPLTGLTFQTVTLTAPGHFIAPSRSFPEFDVFESAVGLAIAPKIDELSVLIQGNDVLIGKENGSLAIAPDASLTFLQNPENPENTEIVITEEKPKSVIGQIYKLDEWIKGGETRIIENEKVLLSEIARQDSDEAKVETYLDLAKLEVANGRGLEAVGFLEIAQSLNKDLLVTPEYLALLGAAHNLSGHYEEAFKAYAHPSFKDNNEIATWRAWSLSGLQDWEQAGKVLPKDLKFLSDYAYPVRHQLALVLTEVALREGRSDIAQTLLDLADKDKDRFSPSDNAAYTYLTGELFRQQGDESLAITTWEVLEKSKDDFYRVKSQFALTRLLNTMNEITTAQAIDRMEGLRFAWRGDDLETQIQYHLGKLYLDEGQIVKGFALLRQAASQSPDRELTRQVTETMTQAFADVFLGEKLSTISPVDAVSLYEEFTELAPTGAEGDLLARKLADRLVEVDLLDRAAKLLKNQLDKRLEGQLALNTSIDLARIQLMDRDAKDALVTVAKAEKIYSALKKPKPENNKVGPETESTLENNATYEDLMLLKARAYSMQKNPDEALKVLAGLRKTVDVVRMQADVAWRTQRWETAARSLGQLVTLQNVTNTRPLDEPDAALILNWAVSLNLADDRETLEDVKKRYSALMKATSQAQEFDVVTRPHRDVFLADRQTINRIVTEVDLFEDFLEDNKDEAVN